MVRDKKFKPGKEQLQIQEEVDSIEVLDEEIEAIAEIGIPKKGFFSGPVAQLTETFASTRLGQLVLIKFDGLLRVIEDTARWSLPQDDNRVQLRRPLPWVFFLSLLVSLRTFRALLTFVFRLFGLQPVTPYVMVYYLQNKRRQLRAIRVQGLKAIESRKNASPDKSARTTPRITGDNAKKNGKFATKIIQLFTSGICKPRQNPELPTAGRLFMQDVKNLENIAERSTKRPRDDDEDAMHNLTVSEMLDKYANENSDNDSDYVPKEEEENDDDDEGSSTSHISTSSSAETAKENKSTGSGTDSTESQKDAEEENVIENSENKSNEAKLQPLAQEQYEIHIAPEIDSEQMHTPKETPEEAKGLAEPEEKINEIPTAAIEVATPRSEVISPRTALQQLAAEWSASKLTPGHESAASQKPFAANTPNAAGSLQDFHSIFHPAPIVKTATDEAQTSTPTEADRCENFTSKASPPMASGIPKKSTTHTAPTKYYNYYNSKGRNKSYR